ncbi:hypothetical protein AK830_g12008 [Neonectria ditissima]|uniref:PD-(D/E)XK nuclease-like domain-containing protein n=1 Tax=Neonectria ditissima TaxID=78410 RepID=A0A0N8H4X2_9HYPO|nr:hypothetical protein AK830_g12008 [Neonectria ditissima]
MFKPGSSSALGSGDDGAPAKHHLDHLNPDAEPADVDMGNIEEWAMLTGPSDCTSTTSSCSGRTPSETSDASDSFSPDMGLARLQLEDNIEYRPFDGEETPPWKLYDLARRMKHNAAGNELLSLLDWAQILRLAADHPQLYDTLELQNGVDFSTERLRYGVLPPVATLIDICNEARKCHDKGLSDASWNEAVRYPLLKTALRHARLNSTDREKVYTVEVTNANSAQIRQPYIPTSLGPRQEKQVDYCVYVDPGVHTPLADFLSAMGRMSSYSSINHTDYKPLANCLISLSIGTVQAGENYQTALARMARWLSAHWKRLNALNPLVLQDFLFLPAIIIDGHDWTFIASTQGRQFGNGYDRMTVIWNKVHIGSTDSFQGICQIVSALQRLATWTGEELFLWFYIEILSKKGFSFPE